MLLLSPLQTLQHEPCVCNCDDIWQISDEWFPMERNYVVASTNNVWTRPWPLSWAHLWSVSAPRHRWHDTLLAAETRGRGKLTSVMSLTASKLQDYQNWPDPRRRVYPELVEWSLFRQKVSIETTLQKLVPIWSLFAPKSLFFEILGPNNASKQQETCCQFRQRHSNRADLMESAVSSQC